LLKPNFLICLVGLPASGKTTFANKFKKFIEQNRDNPKVKIIDPDMIRNALTPDEFDYHQEHLVRKNNLEEVKKSLKEGYIVISDDLNYYSSMRHDLKLITEELDLNFFIIHISTPLEICLKWNEKRGDLLPENVIKKIARKFDGFDKYKWDYPMASINLSKVKSINEVFEHLLSQITYKMENNNKPENKELRLQNSSDLYNEILDKVTRTIVGEILKDSKFNPLKHLILKYRKLYVKLNRNKSLEESFISRDFKDYLAKNLHTKLR
jgi:tRNA uridine 5-carbamoylmethylation protein Kti12